MTISRTRFAPAQRFLHWFMALCILTMLFLGVGMVSTIAPRYLLLIEIHKALGLVILALAAVRLLLRFCYKAPPLPDDLPWPLRMAAESSQYVLYALMFALPLLGWGMLSAASHPVMLFGRVSLPPILPVSATLYERLRLAHEYFAFAFFGIIVMHMAALLFHKLIRRDGIFETMAPSFSDHENAVEDKTEWKGNPL